MEGIKCGEARRLVADIENAMRSFQVTLEKACEGLGTTVGRYEEAKKYLGNIQPRTLHLLQSP